MYNNGKDTLWNLSFRAFLEIHFKEHFMKHEVLSRNTFTVVSKFHCVSFSLIKKCVYREKISSGTENLIFDSLW